MSRKLAFSHTAPISPKRSFAEIADELGCSRQAVQQLERKAFEKIRGQHPELVEMLGRLDADRDDEPVDLGFVTVQYPRT